jgi:hypothetical protein
MDPSYRRIEGNELADTLAKGAIGWRRVRTRRDRSMETRADVTAPRQTRASETLSYRHEIKNQRDSKRSMGTGLAVEHPWQGRSRADNNPDKKVLRVHQSLHRALSTAITQMRTGKI